MNNFAANVQLRQILLKRGNTVEAGSYVGPVGEIVVDTDQWNIRVQDGVTPGGHLGSNSIPQGIDAANSTTMYAGAGTIWNGVINIDGGNSLTTTFSNGLNGGTSTNQFTIDDVIMDGSLAVWNSVINIDGGNSLTTAFDVVLNAGSSTNQFTIDDLIINGGIA